jgi:hypothetical protein
MAASFTIAGRNNGFAKADTRAATLAAVRAYREAMASFAQMGTMDIWYAHLDEDELRAGIRNVVAGTAKQEKGAKTQEKADKRAKAPKKQEKRAAKQERADREEEKAAKTAATAPRPWYAWPPPSNANGYPASVSPSRPKRCSTGSSAMTGLSRVPQR